MLKKLWALAVLKRQGWCLKHMAPPEAFTIGWDHYHYGCKKCYHEGMDCWRARRDKGLKNRDNRKIRALEILGKL
jgi:hypothetical protein